MSESCQIAILMATLNGEKFLKAQLDSIENQNFKNWILYVSDDGSIDETINILKNYQNRWGKEKLEIRQGPKNGYQANFMSLICDPKIKAQFYAFCDQDDVWLPNKLSISKSKLESLNKNIPLLYCARTQYVNPYLRPIGLSPLFSYKPSFGNALVQSIGGGNTMLMNYELKKIIGSIGNVPIVSHDWWFYQIATGVGGSVLYDDEPSILYRQHPDNIIGENTSKLARFERLCLLLKGRFKRWIDINLNALQCSERYLTPENQIILNDFKKMRDSHILHRIQIIKKCCLYRQTIQGSISLWIAAILNKI